jgi:hypothetical protein
MVEATEKLSEEQLEDKISELAKVEQPTEEQKQELQEAKDKKRDAVQRRIDEITSEKKLRDYQIEQERQKNRELQERLEAVESKRHEATVVTTPEYVEAGGQKFYTDTALQAKVTSGQMTESEAYSHQQERIKQEAADLAYNRIKAETQKETVQTQRQKDMEKVLTKHPEWSKDHPRHNPNDPLFMKTVEIFNKGFASNPTGLSEAESLASQLLGRHAPIDNTRDINLYSPSPPATIPKEVTLTENDKQIAYDLYVKRGNVINPKTRRPYTEEEAYKKAAKAKADQEKRQEELFNRVRRT